MKRKLFALMVAPLILCSIAKGSVIAVDFGGNYTSANINSAKAVTQSNGDFDFDGNSDDRVSAVAFGSIFSPPNSANWTNIIGKSNGTIYHGVSVGIFNNQAIDPGITMDRMGSGDVIQIGNVVANTNTLSLAAAIYWNAADFLNGSGSLADEAGSMSVTLNSTGTKPQVHFMVQAGGNWYISSISNTGSFSINGATANWYAFNPTANAMFWNESIPGAAVLGSSLGNITAAGVYAQTDAGYTGATATLFGMSGLQISVIPEPATIGMVGLGAVGLLLVRRFYSK